MTLPNDSLLGKHVVVLTPVFNEASNLLHYEDSVRKVLLSRTDYRFEILFIDDGSSDGSWESIRQICARDPRFRGIRLSRNFGSHVALSAGIAVARADAYVVLACDLQDPPEVVLEFAARWREGAKVVWGKKRSRQDSWWRGPASKLFFWMLRRFAMPQGSKFTLGSFLLIDEQVAECIRQFEEHRRILFALVAWTGFDQAVVEYDRRQRTGGKSGWTFAKMLRTMYDAFVGFSYLPIRLMTLISLLAFLVAFVLGMHTFYCWIVGNPVPGWTSIMVGIATFFGIQFLLMGVSGEYLHRIYLEVVKRPLFFISDRTKPVDSPVPTPHGPALGELMFVDQKTRQGGNGINHDG
jgi:dolichol-phosphate mannosyltransferase